MGDIGLEVFLKDPIYELLRIIIIVIITIIKGKELYRLGGAYGSSCHRLVSAAKRDSSGARTSGSVARTFSGDALFIRVRPTLAPVLKYYRSTRTSGQELLSERAFDAGTWIKVKASTAVPAIPDSTKPLGRFPALNGHQPFSDWPRSKTRDPKRTHTTRKLSPKMQA